MIEHKGTVKLEDEKLILRRFRSTDLKELFVGILQDRKLQETYMIPYQEKSEEAQIFLNKLIQNYNKNSFYCWAIEEKRSGKLAGIVNVVDSHDSLYSCEIGYCVIEAFRKKGIATSALKEVLRYMNSLGYRRITAEHFAENPISGKVMEKAGMVQEGIKKEGVFYQNRFHDLVEYVWIDEDKKYD